MLSRFKTLPSALRDVLCITTSNLQVRRNMRSTLLLALLVQSASASTSFSPNCTLPADIVNFVSSAGVRGTLDILWSSLFTLLICTWTVQHLNVPKQTDDCGGALDRVKEALKRSCTKIKWILVTLIVPEFLVGRAIQDWMMAKKSRRQMRKFTRQDGVKWTWTHAYYANMGGFVLEVDTTSVSTQEENAGRPKVYAYLNADQLYELRNRSTIQRLPKVSVKQISDKSKSDAFVKGTAILQVLWLVIQVIVRGIKHLPVSQLLTYTFSFPKPQNVTVADPACPYPIPLASIKEVENINDRGTSWFLNLALQRNVNILSPIPNDADFDHLPGSEILTFMDVGMVGAGTLFGSLHLIAWNFHFPTPLESLLWKLASVYLAAVLPCYYLLAFIFERLGWLKNVFENSKALSRFENVVAKGVVGLSALSYCVARLCLLVLVFRSLFFLDPETFVTTWARNVPHLQ
jgi:hypothetical protein